MPYPPLLERFEAKFVTIPFHPCWEWVGSKDSWGYGLIAVDRKARKASRVAHVLYKGPIPDGLIVMHTCDNPGCVRPEHLKLGTHKDNMDDCFRKGRARKSFGETHLSAKLTDAQVLELLRRRNAGERGVDLAKEFGIGQNHVWRLCAGLCRKYLQKEK